MTAGLGVQGGFGETTQVLHRFLDEVARWQDVLVHVRLPVPYLDEDMVSIKADAGFSASWTLVEWQP